MGSAGGIDQTKSSLTSVEAIVCRGADEELEGWQGCSSKRSVSVASMPAGEGRFDFEAAAVNQGFVRQVNWAH